jgi:hypothetical protein
MAAKYEGLANVGSFLGGVGSFLPGVGSLIGSLTGANQQPDYASLYAQLAPGQSQITTQQYMLGAAMQPVSQAQGLLTQIYGQSAYDQFKNARDKDQTAAGMLAGIASQYSNAAIGAQDLTNKAKIATETLGLETASKMANTYATAAANLQNQILTGEQGMLLPTATATAAAGQTAQQAKNQLAANIGATNLDIRKQQENTRNAMALQRAQVEGQLALKRYGAGMALAGQAAFA